MVQQEQTPITFLSHNLKQMLVLWWTQMRLLAVLHGPTPLLALAMQQQLAPTLAAPQEATSILAMVPQEPMPTMALQRGLPPKAVLAMPSSDERREQGGIHNNQRTRYCRNQDMGADFYRASISRGASFVIKA